MKVDIISEKKQYFNGKHYWKQKRTGYYVNANMSPHSLHRQVWIYHNGEIPKGLVIDHIDRDKDNNQIDNLRLVSLSENNKNISEQEKQRRIEWMDKIRPLTKEWHKSEEGRKWHSRHGVEVYSKRPPIKKICAHCGKEFWTTQYSKTTRFCGENCQMKARRRRMAGLSENYGSLNKKKVCVICGKEYFTPKNNSYTCSSKCRNKRTVLRRKGLI